jgi:hypothetical protein
MMSLFVDAAIWMKTGPTAMVRALEQFERRQIGLKTVSPPRQDTDRGLRNRIYAAATVWALVVVYLSLGGASLTLQNSAFWAVTIKVFVISWTIWLLLLLRRLTPAK